MALDWAIAAATAVVGVARAGFDSIRGARRDALDSQAAAKGKAMESVGESVDKENEIRKRQEDVPPSVSSDGTGGLSFGEWNEVPATSPAEPAKPEGTG